jgi:hypothetical protein
MQFTSLLKRLRLALLLGAFLGPLGAPARSAPPVQRDSRPLNSDPYPDAARKLGFREWGDTRSSAQVTHVTARLDSERLRVTIALPPNLSVAGAETWLQSLSDAMGWQNVELHANPQPDSLLLRADVRSQVRSLGFGRSEAQLDPALLAAELRKLTPNPALLGIRVVGAELYSVNAPPAVSGRSGSEQFLFYRLSSPMQPAAPLTLAYGIPRRWLAAALVGLLLWLLFPPAALFAVRTYLMGQPEVDAKQRLALYRRWQRGVLVVPMLVLVGALVLSRFSFLTYFGTAFAFATPLAIVLPSTTFALLARLIGMPLERAAWPPRAELPWYRIASVELSLSALILTMVVCSSVTMPAFMRAVSTGAGGRNNGGAVSSRFIILPMLLPLGFVLVAAIRGRVTAYRRKKGTLPNEEDAPQELAGPIRELTARLGCPVERVRLVAQRGGTLAGNVSILGDLALLGKEITESLAVDQVAALVAAAALAQPRTRKDKWLQWSFTAAMLTPAVAIMGVLAFNPGGISANRALLPFTVLIGPLTMVGAMVTQRRTQKRQEQADLLAAESLTEPQRFLQALRQLEELQVAAGGLDPTAARNAAVFQRRTRLERRLGLE